MQATYNQVLSELVLRFPQLSKEAADLLVRDDDERGAYVHTLVYAGLEQAAAGLPGYRDDGFYGWEAVAVRAHPDVFGGPSAREARIDEMFRK
jgi:hypothetical protein